MHGWLRAIFEPPGASTLLFLPLAHSFARIIEVGCLESGVVLGHTPSVATLLPDLASFRPSFILAVPRVLEKVYNGAEQQASASPLKSRSLRGAPRVRGVTVRIAGDGEIFLAGPTIFGGYWHNDSATTEVLADGWLRTGDMGELDEDGYLRVTGRKKELIVTAGGKNVAPAVLEDRIRAHPLVSQCLVVGAGRPYVACLITLDEEAVGLWKARVPGARDKAVAEQAG